MEQQQAIDRSSGANTVGVLRVCTPLNHHNLILRFDIIRRRNTTCRRRRSGSSSSCANIAASPVAKLNKRVEAVDHKRSQCKELQHTVQRSAMLRTRNIALAITERQIRHI